jgi:hypothetical protein
MLKSLEKNLLKKMHSTSWINLLWLLIPFSLIPLQSAHAYLDPGTGSYAVQIIIGLIFGASFFLKNLFAKSLEYFKNLFKPKTEIKTANTVKSRAKIKKKKNE